jgi:hypothetical protein
MEGNMSALIKGNYKINNNISDQEDDRIKNISDIFEKRALERLGGSIAFVMKSEKFVWGEDDEK